jgi:hypothetical protein
MNALWVVVSVIGLFFLRIGVPLLILIGLGVALDTWQRRRAEIDPSARSAPPNPPRPKQPMHLADYPQRLGHIRHRSRS